MTQNDIKKDSLNILILGDVVGDHGLYALQKYLKKIVVKFKVDFVSVNGENCGDNGQGCPDYNLSKIFNYGADVCTLGNHVFRDSDVFKVIEDHRICMPANLINMNYGNKYVIINKNGIRYLVINILGYEGMAYHIDHPYGVVTNILKKVSETGGYDIAIVDYHANFAMEKRMFADLLDGQVTAVVGTHTHTPTADGMIMNNGTYYQSDLGMCGCYYMFGGKNNLGNLYKYHYWVNNSSFKVYNMDKSTISGVLLKINRNNMKVISHKQIIYSGYCPSINNTISL